MFYLMSWAGNHVLRQLEVEVFEQLERLSLGFHTEHDSGDLMSRITNDISTIQQAIGFALVQVVSGVLAVALVGLQDGDGQSCVRLDQSLRRAGDDRDDRLVQQPRPHRISQDAQRDGQRQHRAGGKHFRRSRGRRRSAANRPTSRTSAKATPPTATPTSAPWPTRPHLAPALEALGYIWRLALVLGVGGYYVLRGMTLSGAAVSIGLIVTYLGYVQRFNSRSSRSASCGPTCRAPSPGPSESSKSWTSLRTSWKRRTPSNCRRSRAVWSTTRCGRNTRRRTRAARRRPCGRTRTDDRHRRADRRRQDDDDQPAAEVLGCDGRQRDHRRL